MTDTSFSNWLELWPPGFPQSDAETLRVRLTRLEADAWESVYVRYRDLIHGVLAGWLGYSAPLEATTYAVFERALELVASHEVELSSNDSALRTWLVGIALRAAQLEEGHKFKAHEPLNATASSDRQLLGRAQSISTKLPAHLRVCWLLRHLEAMSLEEIAASTSAPMAVVERRLAQADALFAKLAEQDPVLREHLSEAGAA